MLFSASGAGLGGAGGIGGPAGVGGAGDGSNPPADNTTIPWVDPAYIFR